MFTSPRPATYFHPVLLLLAAICPPGAKLAAEPTDSITPKLLAEHGKGKLWQVGEQRLLLLAGTHYEMGVQHGKLLGTEARECLKMFMDDFAIAREGNTRETFAAIWKQAEPNIPQRYKDELRGLADGSGIPLTEVQLLHVIPEKYHCSGAAAFGAATRDGKLYHTRSLDYYLDIGKDKVTQDHAITIVYQPDDGFAHVNVAWAGFAGCVTGMNIKGISVGEMGCKAKAETYDGLPMIFLVREILLGADSLDRAVEITKRAPRTCGYNFIYGDGKVPAASAIEVTKDVVKVFPAGGAEENVAPHFAIPNCVRRVNHFVDKELAAGQRDGYDPRFSDAASWFGYQLISNELKKRSGKLDAEGMMGILRTYPPAHPCLHQAVFAPTDREIYVSIAKNPRKVRHAGAQNQTFYRYRLDKILEGVPGAVEMYAPSAANAAPKGAGAARPMPGPAPAVADAPAKECGRVPAGPRTRVALNGAQGKIREFLAEFDKPAGAFEWEMTDRPTEAAAYTLHRLTFPSPVTSPDEVNNTVIADYYRPTAPGRRPAVIVLDILDGRNIASGIACDHLAKCGVAALSVRLAYFGERRPPGPRFAGRLLGDPGMLRASMIQTVADIGRAAAWLRTRPEIDGDRLGICGISMGGFVAGLASGVYGDFAKTVLILSAGDLADVIWNGRGEKAVENWLAASKFNRSQLAQFCELFDPLTYAARIPAGTVLMLNGKQDTIVPPAASAKLAAALAGCKQVWYDAGHYTFALHAFDAMKRLSDHILAEPAKAAADAKTAGANGGGRP